MTTGKNTSLTISSVYAAKGDASGEIDLNWDAIENADSYVIEISENNGKAKLGKYHKWSILDITNESKYTAAGLKNNKTYLFRVAAVDSKQQGPWSSAAEKRI